MRRYLTNREMVVLIQRAKNDFGIEITQGEFNTFQKVGDNFYPVAQVRVWKIEDFLKKLENLISIFGYSKDGIERQFSHLWTEDEKAVFEKFRRETA